MCADLGVRTPIGASRIVCILCQHWPALWTSDLNLAKALLAIAEHPGKIGDGAYFTNMSMRSCKTFSLWIEIWEGINCLLLGYLPISLSPLAEFA